MAATMPMSIAHHYVPVDTEFRGIDGREFGRSVIDSLEHGKRHVVVDCSDWHRLDFVLLSALVKCADLFSSRGADLEIVNLTPEMRANIRELRLQDRLRIVD